MLLLDPERRGALRPHLPPERPGPLVAPHVHETGLGACFVDRWPEPRAGVAEVADNRSLWGDPTALPIGFLAQRVSGFVEAPTDFLPVLRVAHPDLQVWDRVILELDRAPDFEPPAALRAGAGGRLCVRRLVADDAWQLFGLEPGLDWVAKTHGGPAALAQAGLAWGGFADDRLVSVAVPFFVGGTYEDLGVVTAAAARGLGLSPACACGVARDVLGRGRRASWSTSPDNRASLAVARKLGFREVRRDVLYVIGEELPAPAEQGDT